MPRYYSRRVKHPCRRCNFSCETHFISCAECNKRIHQKCLHITNKMFKALNKETFVCSKNCEFRKFPFHSISDREFITINKKNSKYPCLKCNGECHKKMERVKCGGCSRWLHLKCTELTKQDFSHYLSNTNNNVFRCSMKCEVKLFPFNNLNCSDFIKYISHGKLQYSNKAAISKKQRTARNKQLKESETSPPIPMCQYLEPSQVTDILNDGCLNDLSVFHSNVRSLRKNLDKILEIFQNGTKLPDIVGVTETKVKDTTNETDIDGYSFEHCSSPTEAGGAGIYIANFIDYSVRDDLSMGLDNCEDVWIEVVSQNESKHTKFSSLKNIVIGIVYRHPSSQYTTFCEKLCSNIDDINRSGKKVVITGDVNINLEKMNTVGTITDYLHNIQGAGCLSFIDKPTRVVKRGKRWESSCIDHMYSNIEPIRMQNYVITSDVSDHFSTLTKIVDANAINVSKKPIYRRKKRLNPEEQEKFNQELTHMLSRNKCFEHDSPYNVNDQTKHLVSCYEFLTNKYMPLKRISKKEKKNMLKPWITQGIRKSILIRDKLRKKVSNLNQTLFMLYTKSIEI